MTKEEKFELVKISISERISVDWYDNCIVYKEEQLLWFNTRHGDGYHVSFDAWIDEIFDDFEAYVSSGKVILK